MMYMSVAPRKKTIVPHKKCQNKVKWTFHKNCLSMYVLNVPKYSGEIL